MDQWSDRQVYWKARALSRLTAIAPPWDSSIHLLTLMVDGMDQGKFRLPRTKRFKVKAMDKFVRPALHVAGVLAHGYGLHLACSMPDISKDTNTNIETVARMLDTILEQRGSLPQHLWLQQDNCPRECKNQKIFRWCIAIVMRGHQLAPKIVGLGNCPRPSNSLF
jgi:hypothetical protein